MASLTDLFLRIGHITSAGPREINGDDTQPYHRPGSITILTDAYGTRILKYVKHLDASTMGQLKSAASGGTDQRSTSFTLQSGTNNTVQAAITGATANRHIGMIFWVQNSTAGTGVAPEAEASIVVSNTATVMKLDPAYPLSATLTATDTVQAIANWQCEAGAAGDQAWVVEGVAVAPGGVTAGNYGWVQQEGPCVANSDGTATVLGSPIVAGATSFVADDGAQTNEDWIGYALGTGNADQVNDRILANMKLFTGSYGITAH